MAVFLAGSKLGRPGLEPSWHGPKVRSWSEFQQKVKQPDRPLLAELDRFPDAILVGGCQRSGTTALTRLIGQAEGTADYRFGADDELDAALILAGHVRVPIEGRCCFQTTYLNDRFNEYLEHEGFRLIWVLREPLSVVYSMLNHWRRAALDRLYEACGKTVLDRSTGLPRLGFLGPSRLEKACASYVAKISQTFDLASRLHPDRMMVIDYDELVTHKQALLEHVFEFVGLTYRPSFADALHSRSVSKGRSFSPAKAAYIEALCSTVYMHARAYRTVPEPAA